MGGSSLTASKEDVDRLAEYKFQTLINCAACVKHFAAGDVLEKINVIGVENLIDLCKNNARRLIHISIRWITAIDLHHRFFTD